MILIVTFFIFSYSTNVGQSCVTWSHVGAVLQDAASRAFGVTDISDYTS